MNDKTLVERVIAWLDGGCSSWNVPSSDIRQMATRIEALEAALREYLNDPYIQKCGGSLNIRAQQALEGTGNG